MLGDLEHRGAHVRGFWRSHPRHAHFGEQDNSPLAHAVNEAGGQLLLHGAALQPIHEWAARFERLWDHRYDRLDDLLVEIQHTSKERG